LEYSTICQDAGKDSVYTDNRLGKIFSFTTLFHAVCLGMVSQTTNFKEVIVSVFGGGKVKRVAVKELVDVILVCKLEELQASQLENREPVTVAIKREDIEFA